MRRQIGPQDLEAGDISASAVEFLEKPALFIRRERDTCDLLRRLQHLDRNRFRILSDSREGAGHQRRSDASCGNTLDEAASIDPALPFVHVGSPG